MNLIDEKNEKFECSLRKIDSDAARATVLYFTYAGFVALHRKAMAAYYDIIDNQKAEEVSKLIRQTNVLDDVIEDIDTRCFILYGILARDAKSINHAISNQICSVEHIHPNAVCLPNSEAAQTMRTFLRNDFMAYMSDLTKINDILKQSYKIDLRRPSCYQMLPKGLTQSLIMASLICGGYHWLEYTLSKQIIKNINKLNLINIGYDYFMNYATVTVDVQQLVEYVNTLIDLGVSADSDAEDSDRKPSQKQRLIMMASIYLYYMQAYTLWSKALYPDQQHAFAASFV